MNIMISFIETHQFFPLTFIKHLLCARHCDGLWMNKNECVLLPQLKLPMAYGKRETMKQTKNYNMA